jgi:TonB-linked SusC/RagA family outer membrane protein
MRNLFIIFIFLLCAFFTNSSYSQNIISGAVIDEQTQLPVSEASVSAGAAGVQTDSAGHFSINASIGTQLIVSHINYNSTTYTITRGSRNIIISLRMNEAKNSMNAVVVVGFQKKSKIISTAATTVITSDDIKDVPAANVADLLQGKIAGVNIQNTSGAPGARGSIFQRGLSNLTVTGDGNNAYLSTTQPLIIIDGVPIDPNTDNEYGFAQAGPGISPLALIPSEDIESVEILKDASATSVYGSRGAYGVWVITTKRGRTPRPQIVYTGNLFMSDVPKLRDIYGGRLERELKIFQIVNNNEMFSDSYGLAQVNLNYLLSDSLNPYLNNSTNWQSYFYRPVYNHSHNVQFSGGDPNFNYKVNLSYYDEKGIIKNTGLTRYSVGMNTIYQTKNNRFRLLAAITATNAKNKKGSGVGLLQTGVATSGMASTLLPPPDIYTENSGALAAFEIDDDNKTNSLLSNLTLELEPLKNLRFKTEGNLNIQTAVSNTFYPSWLNTGSQYGISTGLVSQSQYNTYNRTANNYQNRNSLSYAKSFNDKMHNFSAFIFSEITGAFSKTNYSLLYGAPNDNISGPIGFNLARSIYGTLGYQDGKTFAYGGSFSYNYLQKYVLDVNFRQDGSSTTGPLAGYRQNPSVAFRWNFFKEKIMERFSWLDYGAIRGSWGKTVTPQGNIFSVYGRYFPSGTYLGQPSVLLDYNNSPNPIFLPVTSTQYNLGYESGFFKNRLTIEYDYYYRMVENQAYFVELPRETGYNTIPGNEVSMVNYGHELSLSFRPLPSNSKLNWRIQLNGAYNKSVLTKLPNNLRQLVYNPNDQLGLPVLYRLGRNPLGNLLYNTKGVYATYADVPYDPLTGKRVQINGRYLTEGDPIFADLNGDYTIDANDRVAVGDPQPKLVGGFINTMNYKNFGLTISTSYTFFRDVLNTPLARTFQYFYYPDNTNIAGSQVLPPISEYNYWKKSGDQATYPYPFDYQQNRAIDAFRYNQTLFMEDGSYFKFNYVTLSYTLNKDIARRLAMANARVYFTGKNLLVISNYSGPNPENVSDLGRDNPYGYPNPRQYSIGINATF